MSLYLGMDFGTSSNCVMQWDEKKQKAVPVENLDSLNFNNAKRIIENVIYYNKPGDFALGESALARSYTSPENVVTRIKRHLTENNWYQHIPNLHEDRDATTVARDIFRELKKKIESNKGGEKIDWIVLTVPCDYSHNERQKIKRAANDAGLLVKELLEEPVAAALAYGLLSQNNKARSKEKIVVFDMGGGTLDLAVFDFVRYNGSVNIEVLNTYGDKSLGGNKIDSFLRDAVLEKAGVLIEEFANSHETQELDAKIRVAKEELSEDDITDVYLVYNNRKKELNVTFEREEFDFLLKKKRVLSEIKEALKALLSGPGAPKLSKEEIDKIILVGGSSSIPAIRKCVEEFFGKEALYVDKDPLEMVGEGAAIYCGCKLNNNSNFEVVQKISQNIGVKKGENFVPLIKKNSRQDSFYGVLHYEKPVDRGDLSIEIFKGLTQDVNQCSSIGTVKVLAEIIQGEKIGIQLGLDNNGIVKYRILDGERIALEAILS